MNLGYVLLASRNPQNYFYQCVPGGFSYLSNKLEKLKFKLEKNIGIEKHAGKIRIFLFFLLIKSTELESTL